MLRNAECGCAIHSWRQGHFKRINLFREYTTLSKDHNLLEQELSAKLETEN